MNSKLQKSISLDLSSRFVIVTGAAGAIGQAVCKMYRAMGARCLASDLCSGNDIEACDITDESSVISLFDAAENIGQITDVVHGAGILSAISPIEDITVQDFRQVIDINLTGSFLIAREAARRLKKGGTITLISSQAGLKGGAYWSAYSASKGGVNRLVDCLAEELGPRGIRVNAICPGGVQAPMLHDASKRIADITGDTAESTLNRYSERNPMKRLATPDDVAGACVFLSSILADYVHGTSLVVDGGELSR